MYHEEDLFQIAEDRRTYYKHNWFSWAKYIAQDSNGVWHVYSCVPKLNYAPRVPEWTHDKGLYSYLFTTPLHPKGWDHTLIELSELLRE